MIIMPKEFKIGDTMIFSQVISLEDKESVNRRNLHESSSKSIMIDVLLMILCERSENNSMLENPELDSD